MGADKCLDKNSKILVVGGAGFIGSCLVDSLIKRGYGNIIIFDNFSTGSRDFISSICEIIEGDIKNSADFVRLPGDIDYVFHLAAASSVEESFVKPRFYLENNVYGTINLLEWIAKNKIKKIVYASSGAVYGNVSPGVIMHEDLLPDPNNYYGLTKLDGEFLVRIQHLNFSLDYAIMRYFNVFGERQECTSNYASVIPKFIYAALRHKELTIYGSGKQARDFVHVQEAAEATILAMERGFGIYNVASGGQYDINTIARLILGLVKTESKIVYLPPVPGDTMFDKGSNERLVKLGWQRNRTFQDWLRETTSWYQQWYSKKNLRA